MSTRPIYGSRMSPRKSMKNSRNQANSMRPHEIQSTLKPAVNDVLTVAMVVVNSVKSHTEPVTYAANIKTAQCNTNKIIFLVSVH